MKQTSEDSPIRVDFLPDGVTSLPGRVGLTFAPGKKDWHWDRCLEADLTRLHDELGVSVLVCLLEAFELDELHMSGYEPAVSRAGMALYRLPIRDVSVPTSLQDTQRTVAYILGRARAGENVAIHCRGGLGRTGLVAACCLVALGRGARESIALVRNTRENAVETTEQARWVEEFERAARW